VGVGGTPASGFLRSSQREMGAVGLVKPQRCFVEVCQIVCILKYLTLNIVLIFLKGGQENKIFQFLLLNFATFG